MTAAPFNFGGLSRQHSTYASANIAILPIPFDKTSTYGKGADQGPRAIIEASRYVELYDIETGSEVYKHGITTERPVKCTNSKAMLQDGYLRTKRLLLDGKFVVTVGGEHSISFAPIRAHAEHFRDLSVLQLDAHTDLRDSYEGSKHNHACVMARVQEVVDTIVSVGIRSMDSSELSNAAKTKVFFAHQIHNQSGWIKQASKALTKNVYVTIDLDVFNTGLLPATGTPEPGGLDWYTVLNLLRTVVADKNLVGFDVVELCPTKERSSDFVAAKLIYTLLSYKFGRRYMVSGNGGR